MVGETSIGATGTGTLFIGVNSTTSRAVRLAADGTMFVSHTGTADVAVVSIPEISGTVTALPSGTQTVLVAAQPIGVSGTVTPIGPLVVTASANPLRVVVNAITTGTVSIVGTPVITATVSVLPAISGSVSVINTPTITGSVTALGTPFPVIATHHASNWSVCVVSTTSGGGHAILKTSGAHTLYVTDLMISVDVPMMVAIYSSSAAQAPKMVVYLATKGGFVAQLKSPMILTSAQSLVFIGNASGSCAAFAAGYTVT